MLSSKAGDDDVYRSEFACCALSSRTALISSIISVTVILKADRTTSNQSVSTPVLPEKASQISSAVKHAHQFNSIENLAIKNQIVSHRKHSQSRAKIIPRLSHSRRGRDCVEDFIYCIDEMKRSRWIVLGDVTRDFINVSFALVDRTIRGIIFSS